MTWVLLIVLVGGTVAGILIDSMLRARCERRGHRWDSTPSGHVCGRCGEQLDILD